MTDWKNKLMPFQTMRARLLSGAIRKRFITAGSALLFIGANAAHAQDQSMMVRMSEIVVDAKYLEQYKAILKEEAEASVRLEPGVIAIFPMYQRENASEFRIIEIYASRAAYEAHLKTPHFQAYKSGTSKMVASLKLVDMETLDAATMQKMFRKLNQR